MKNRSKWFVVTVTGFLLATRALAGAPQPLPPPASGADAYRQLLAYTALGPHRTGTAGGDRVTAWLDQQLRSFGLQPRIETFAFTRFVPHEVALKLRNGQDIPVFPYWYSGATGRGGIDAKLLDLGTGSQAEFDAAQVAGRLVLVDVPLQLRAFYPDLAAVMRRASGAGAVGLVAVTRGAPGNLIAAANAESEAGLCGLPVLFVGAEDGDRLRSGPHDLVHFTLDADIEAGHAANVVATLPGASAETLIVGTPVNGWFTTATERGGGVGTLLSLARAHAADARDHKPAKTLIFVFTAGHEVGYLGLQRYIDAHPDVIKRTYAYVHLGASVAAAYSFLQRDGSVASAPDADPSRFLFVSENPLLQRLVSHRQWTTPLMPVQSILPSVFNPGEQRRLYAQGIPMVSISGTSLYFHTTADTAENTSAELLDPLVRFYDGVIDDLLATDPSQLLAANGDARVAAKPVPEPACAVPLAAPRSLPRGPD